jgi:uncharacterized protein YjhX (UPF0386 family)
MSKRGGRTAVIGRAQRLPLSVKKLIFAIICHNGKGCCLNAVSLSLFRYIKGKNKF